MTSKSFSRRTTPLPYLLGAGGVLAVLALGILLLVFYRFPWGGNFNPSLAGTAAAWVGDLFTVLGILALLYQLSQLRLSRVDETTREINSLYTHISTKPWERGKAVDGKLVYVYVQNDGERKAMDIEIAVTLQDGQLIPEGWVIERLHRFSLPPSMTKPKRALLLHVPTAHEQQAFGQGAQPCVTVSWTDPWSRRVEMIDNRPSIILGQVAISAAGQS